MPSMMLKDAAQKLNIGAQTFYRLLKQKGVINPKNNLPRRDLVMSGHFEVEEREYTDRKFGIKKPYSVNLVTTSGLSYLKDLLKDEIKPGGKALCKAEQQH